MTVSPPVVRRGEYAARGDYHRTPDPDWDYYPTYIAKLEAVRQWLESASPAERVLDAGCGEGILVEEFAGRLAIEGIDANYSSDRVRSGSVTALPYAEGTFDRAMCLDVLEHLTFEEQPRALAELFRVLRPGGRAARLGPEPRAPPVSGAFRAARPADPHSIRVQASGGPTRRRVHRACATGWVRADESERDLSDRAGAHTLDSPPPACPAAAPSTPVTPASNPRLVLPERADIPEALSAR